MERSIPRDTAPAASAGRRLAGCIGFIRPNPVVAFWL